jgi:drug/metabolite transporter (DMT)-like permease
VLPLALKVALASMDPYTITWYRFLAAALVLGSILAHRRRLPSLGRLARSGWALLGVATVFLTANYVSYLIGLHYTTPANSQVLIQLAPVLLALGGLVVFRERFAHLQWVGFGVLVLGLGTFVRDQADAGVRVDDYHLGSLLILLAAVTWAVYGLAQKQLLRWLAPQAIMVCIYAGCAALLSPFSTPRQILDMDALGVGMLVFCAFNTLIAYGTFSEALVHWEASRVGAVLALTPVVTIAAQSAATGLWPRFASTATISPVGLLGAALVVVGSLLAALGQTTELDSLRRDE